MSEKVVWDKSKGEIRIWGERHTTIDPKRLCDHLSALVGAKVASVMMNNLEYRLGKDAVAQLRKEKPQAEITDLIDTLIELDAIAGIGVVKVTFATKLEPPVVVEIGNPCMTENTGAAKSYLFSWWAGALTALLNRQLDPKDGIYEKEKDIISCQLVPRA